MNSRQTSITFLITSALLFFGVLLWLSAPNSSADTLAPLAKSNPAANSFLLLPTSTQITITNSGFSPMVVTVTQGTQVTWYNSTTTTQTLQSGTPSFSQFLPFITNNSTSHAPVRANPTPNPRGLAPRVASSATFSATIPPGGTYSYTFNATGDYPYFLSNHQQFTGHVVVQGLSSSPDFTLSAQPPSQTVIQGNSATYTVNVTGTNGFSSPVSLLVLGLPSGASASFGNNLLTPNASSLVTITTAANTTPSTYPLTVQASGGGITYTAPITLIVQPIPQPDFTLGINPSSQSVIQGNSVTYTAIVTGINGYNLQVALSVLGLPQGATGSFGTNPLTPNGSSVLTITTALTTSVSSFPLGLQGGDGSITHTIPMTLVVQPVPQDFTIGVQPASQTVTQGNSITYTVNVTGVNGFSSSLTLSVSGLPSGASGTFGTNPVTPNGSSVLTVTTSVASVASTYGLTVKAVGGDITHTVPATLIIQPGPDFTLAAQPTTQTVTQGSSITYTLSVTGTNGFSSPVTLLVPGLPDGASATFDTNPVVLNGSSVLTITTALTTPISANLLNVQGSGGSITHTIPIMLNVQAPPDFTLTAQPTSQSVLQGSSATYTMNVTGTNGFSSPVTLSVTGLPQGASGTFGTNPVTPNGSSTLTVTTALTTSASTYPLTVQASGGGITHTAPITLVVQSPPDFLIASSPASQSVIQGQSITFTTQLTSAGGFNSPVNLSVTGLPTGMNALFAKNPITPTASTVLTVTTQATVAVGTYPLIVSGTSGSLIHSTAISVSVTSAPDFQVSTTPSSQNTVQGQAANFTTQLNALNGFNLPVTLSIAGVPTGASASFGANPITPTASTPLTITTQPTINVGTYPMTVTAISGTLVHSNTITMTVNVAQANLCGTISTNMTLYANTTYTVTCNVTVNSGVNLAVQPGATIQFNQNTGLGVNGTLTAIGTASQMITFTANITTPTPGYWRGIYVTGRADLGYMTLRYGGATSGYNTNLYVTNNGTATLDHVTWVQLSNCEHGRSKCPKSRAKLNLGNGNCREFCLAE